MVGGTLAGFRYVALMASIVGLRERRERVIARLAYGEVLKTLKRSGGWIKLQGQNGLRGWVSRSLLWGW